ncbi:MAG TPA: thiamine-phosphate kinase [Arenimonas sp.]|nr:thiamine-phosphate kinase [Arenimonas sp.]
MATPAAGGVAAATEFSLIDRIRARCIGRDDVVLGIGDDGALLQPPAGQQLVVSTDTLVAGVHFPEDTAPADIGWKALAVNLSDLAAMAAQPAWCTLALTLPGGDAAWLDGFLDGFLDLAARHDIALVGGDTTRGPLAVTVTVMGFVPAGQALRRDAARVGDEIWVTGTLGDAAAALRQWQVGVGMDADLRRRLDRPTPRIDVGLALRGLAAAGIDLSDGLLADLGHVLKASGVGAELQLAALPTSAALHALQHDDQARWPLQLSGGDDYELCFTAPPAHHDAIVAALSKVGPAAQVIGRIVAGSDLALYRADGNRWQADAKGYQHFVERNA